MLKYKKSIQEDLEDFKKFLEDNKKIQSKQQFKKLSFWIRRLFNRLILDRKSKEVQDCSFVFDLYNISSTGLKAKEWHMSNIIIYHLVNHSTASLDQERLKYYKDETPFTDRIKFYSEWFAEVDKYIKNWRKS